MHERWTNAVIASASAAAVSVAVMAAYTWSSAGAGAAGQWLSASSGMVGGILTLVAALIAFGPASKQSKIAEELATRTKIQFLDDLKFSIDSCYANRWFIKDYSMNAAMMILQKNSVNGFDTSIVREHYELLQKIVEQQSRVIFSDDFNIRLRRLTLAYRDLLEGSGFALLGGRILIAARPIDLTKIDELTRALEASYADISAEIERIRGVYINRCVSLGAVPEA